VNEVILHTKSSGLQFQIQKSQDFLLTKHNFNTFVAFKVEIVDFIYVAEHTIFR